MEDINQLMNSVDYNKMEYFSAELREGIFLIGLDMGGEGVDGRAITPGHATSNSYLIVGKEKALLIDSMADKPGFKEFAQDIAKVPVMFALSHAHLDHIIRLKDFDEFWLHKDDEELLQGAYGMPIYENIPDTVHYLQQGDVIDLGDRFVEIFHVKGHTMGSLLFLDKKTKTLISGDTIARRLLYGISGWVPLDEFAQAILELEKQDFDGILSAHDRFLLPKSHIRYMIDTICKIKETNQTQSFLNIEFMQAVSGNENEVESQDITFPAVYIESVMDSVRKIKERLSLQ